MNHHPQPSKSPSSTTIGIIADTHGRLRAEAVTALAGSDYIPGSAGPRRFTLPVTCAILTLSPNMMDAQIIHLPI